MVGCGMVATIQTDWETDRKSKKHSLTAAETKTILQKVNHDGKAESYVPDEGTRKKKQKNK